MSGEISNGEFSGLLRDQDLDLAQVVSAAERDRWLNLEGVNWLVVVDDDGSPVVATGPGREQAALLIVADSELPVAAVVDSRAFDEAEQGTAVVVVEQGGPRVLGVWTGPALIRAMTANWSGVRDATAPSGLPGYPRIPYIVRSCGFADADAVCGTSSTFRSKPIVMPPCANPGHLPQHSFVW